MEDAHPLIRELFPGLMAELVSCLEAEGEAELAISVRDVRLYQWCGCGDDFCQSFRTAPPPDGAYGPGYRNVSLNSERGYLILDVVRDQIMFVEVLYYPDLRDA
ncbi:hypothetical protein [Acrocarpospora catenulata]|uniref:hypothetical protein n=1 Tax=Acrocarpospora catenulata TaxID=2836182 RepID=UPI001BD91668|nr:hypothetical protein [Acrocarpospora catenulata]